MHQTLPRSIRKLLEHSLTMLRIHMDNHWANDVEAFHPIWNRSKSEIRRCQNKRVTVLYMFKQHPSSQITYISTDTVTYQRLLCISRPIPKLAQNPLQELSCYNYISVGCMTPCPWKLPLDRSHNHPAQKDGADIQKAHFWTLSF